MNRSILKNKFYLYMTEFFSGMSVMAVELGASRLLAPYFSSSQIVWTIIIGTIMIAMALGNVWGGKNADKDPNPDRLYLRLIVAAVWIAAIPFLGKYVILLISGILVLTVSEGFLIWAAFLSCMLIFVFPLFLLGTVSPALVKYTIGSLDEGGRVVGRLNAFNTVGSIIGTFAPTFITIPTVGTSITFLVFSAILLLIGLIYFISTKVRLVKCAVLSVLFVLFSIGSSFNTFAFWESDLLYEGESVYNYLQVSENENRISLSTNVLFGVQSVKQKGGGLTGSYYDYALAAPVLANVLEKDRVDILVLGMGTGTFAMQCREYFGDRAEIRGVEIDEAITDLAYRYFDLAPDIEVTTYDGRAYLAAVKDRYDVIMVDAYQDITIPFQMSSSEFFAMVAAHLKDDGVMVVNMNMRSEKPGNINDYLADTIGSVFPYVRTVDVNGSSNRELFAAKTDVFASFADRIDAIATPELQSLMRYIGQRLTPHESHGYLLTDDRAPVELLGMDVIDGMIMRELSYYKKLVAEHGIAGLLRSFR